MRSRINGLIAIIGLVLLTTYLIFAKQLKPSSVTVSGTTEAPIAANSFIQSYPPPGKENFSTQTEINGGPYPGPADTTTKVQMNDCTKMGTWIEQINNTANFSFQYPAEAKLSEWTDHNGYTNIVLYLRPRCYVKECSGPKQVGIGILTNNEKLSLNEFVVKHYSFDTSTDRSVLSTEIASVTTNVIVDQIAALQVNGKITNEAPHVYIPYDDLVIFVGLEETSHMPPFVQACPTTLDTFNKILSSIKFIN